MVIGFTLCALREGASLQLSSLFPINLSVSNSIPLFIQVCGVNITFIVFKAIWADQNLLALFLFKFVGGQNFYRLKAI